MATTRAPDGVEIAYEVTGEGAPLVLVHGITECRRLWDPLVPALAADHTVVALDVRGHGESAPADAYDASAMAGDVAAVVAAAGLEPPLVIGHSMGGLVATAFAGTHGCAGVVNVDQSIALRDFQELVRGAEPLLRSDAFTDVITALFDSMLGPLPPAEAARIAALRRPDREVVLGVWAPLLELAPPALDELVATMAAAVTVPYLALHGTEPGAGYGAWLASAIPTSALEVWDHHGHYPHLVDPDRFVDRVRRFESTWR